MWRKAGEGYEFKEVNKMNIMPLPALSDNYIWIIEKNNRIVVVDPSEADLLLQVIKSKGYVLEAVLLTHKHQDHIGGVRKLVAAHPAPVYGPKETGISSEIVKGGEVLSLLGEEVKVMATPGHTAGHVAYQMKEHVFIGDTLFLSSCGRVFSGDYDAMFHTLEEIKKLDEDTIVYPAHEYSLSNLEQTVKTYPTEAVKGELARVRKLREAGKVTLPTTIKKEKAVNPFLNFDDVKSFKDYRELRDRT